MEYYIYINNEKRGPYSLDELRARNIDNTTLVMATDSDQWTPAWQIDELRQVMADAAEEDAVVGVPIGDDAEPAPVGSEEVPEPQTKPATAEPQKARHNYGGCLVGLLIVVIIGATMVFTCPNQQAHKEKLTQLVTNSVNEVISKNITGNGTDLLSRGIQMVSGMMMGKIVDTAVDNMLTVDNYVVCSLGKVNYEGEDHVISVGVLGHIFTVNQDQVTKATEKYYLDFQQQAGATVKDQLQQNIVDPLKDQLQETVIDPLKDAMKGAVGDILGELGGLLDEPSDEEE